MVLLWLAGTASCVGYALDTTQPINWQVGVVLFGAVLISTTFQFWQEGKASAVMKSFRKMLPRRARVVRDGHVHDVPASSVVVGDIIVIQTGDSVPADLRLIYAQELKVEKSSLTGEALPVTMTTQAAPDQDKIEEAQNLVFNTSQCMEGEGVGVVFATGDDTLIGRIANMVSRTTTSLTPVQIEVKRFVTAWGLFGFALGVVFLCIGLGRHKPWIQAVIGSFIIVMIAIVPEVRSFDWPAVLTRSH
jgi:sodium/potassium-transporting ATPase subunit alpha